MLRRRCRCFRSRSRTARSSGDARSTTSPARRWSTGSRRPRARTNGNPRRGRGGPGNESAPACRTAARTASIDARKVARPRSCPGSISLPSMAKAPSASWRSSGPWRGRWWDARKATPSVVAESAVRTARASVCGPRPLRAGRSERRQRQAADRLDDAVELQRPQRAVVHLYILNCHGRSYLTTPKPLCEPAAVTLPHARAGARSCLAGTDSRHRPPPMRGRAPALSAPGTSEQVLVTLGPRFVAGV